MVKKKKVVWDELARTALKEAYTYIKGDSLQQAEKVKQEIIATCKKLADYPEIYPPDKYRKDKDILFRALKSTTTAYLTSLVKILFVCCGSVM